MNYFNCAWCGSVQDSLSGNPKSCRNCGAPTKGFAVDPPPVLPAENLFFNFLEPDIRHKEIGPAKTGQQNSFAMSQFFWTMGLLLFLAFLIAMLGLSDDPDTPVNELAVDLITVSFLVVFGTIGVAVITKSNEIWNPESRKYVCGLRRRRSKQLDSPNGDKMRLNQTSRHARVGLNLSLVCSISCHLFPP